MIPDDQYRALPKKFKEIVDFDRQTADTCAEPVVQFDYLVDRHRRRAYLTQEADAWMSAQRGP